MTATTTETETETITAEEALERIADAARAHGHDLAVKEADDAVLLGRTLSRGRFQRIGRIWIEDGEARWEAHRIRATVRDIADTVAGCHIKD